MDTISTLLQQNIHHQRVLFRADLNLPTANGKISDITRIIQHKKSLLALLEAGARVIMLSHFGRPTGDRQKKFSLTQTLKALEEQLEQKIDFSPDCVGSAAAWVVARRKTGIVVMENTRFHAGETQNQLNFAKQLAALGKFFVHDAFSVAHRANASTEALTHLLPTFAGHGLLEEVRALENHLSTPKRPALAITGGIKIADKLTVIKGLLPKMDVLAIGGAMANAFLVALGKMSQTSAGLADQDITQAQDLLEEATKCSCRLVLPSDVVVAKELRADSPSFLRNVEDVPEHMLCLDIGTQSIAALAAEIEQAETILWNGPLGAYEIEPFHQASIAVVKKIAAAKAISIAGGGETVNVINMTDCASGFTHVSTGGGAFLAWLAGRPMPSLKALGLRGYDQSG